MFDSQKIFPTSPHSPFLITVLHTCSIIRIIEYTKKKGCKCSSSKKTDVLLHLVYWASFCARRKMQLHQLSCRENKTDATDNILFLFTSNLQYQDAMLRWSSTCQLCTNTCNTYFVRTAGVRSKGETEKYVILDHRSRNLLNTGYKITVAGYQIQNYCF